MKDSEKTSWFIQAKTGTESILQFMGVVEKINHEQNINNPHCTKSDCRLRRDRARIVRDLQKIGEDDGASETEDEQDNGEDHDDNLADDHQEDHHECAGDTYKEVIFEEERRYGIPPTSFRRRVGQKSTETATYLSSNTAVGSTVSTVMKVPGVARQLTTTVVLTLVYWTTK